jgi:hypothetical protein
MRWVGSVPLNRMGGASGARDGLPIDGAPREWWS